MKHDEKCELMPDSKIPWCKCAERRFLLDCSPEELAAYRNRSGYDHSVDRASVPTW